MQGEVIVNKKAVCPFGEKHVLKVVEILRTKEKRLSGPIEINIVGKNEIKKINRQYRGINMATDVLSFAWQEESKIKGEILGQVYICYPKIKEQAKKLGATIAEEFVRILAHGLLHLVGYDHYGNKEAKIMFDVQEKTVKKYFRNSRVI